MKVTLVATEIELADGETEIVVGVASRPPSNSQGAALTEPSPVT